MVSATEISSTVDTWIGEEQLPTRPGLMVISMNDPDYGLSEEEIEDKSEFIRWYFLQDQILLLLVPKQTPESDFFICDCDVSEHEYGAFNTHDYERLMRPFDKYAYAVKKILERVQDLAILYSSISFPEGRLRTYRRYQALVDMEFRERLLILVAQHGHTMDPDRRLVLKEKIGELNRRILDCKGVWERYAPRDA